MRSVLIDNNKYLDKRIKEAEKLYEKAMNDMMVLIKSGLKDESAISNYALAKDQVRAQQYLLDYLKEQDIGYVPDNRLNELFNK